MDRHASLNRIYRLVWSHVHKTWVVVSETARGRGKGAKRKLLLAAAVSAATQLAHAGPAGGQVTAGTGAIQQSGSTTTINQSSQNLSLSWQSFNTNSGETVNFVQPSSSAIAVNRIFDTNGTQFMGRLNANGQVYLINPNGVLFGASSQVNVGGLVASTLDVDDAALNSGTRRFSGAGTGSVVNQGRITAANGGYVAFIGNSVSNQGNVNAPAGSVALGAGSDVTLSFAGNSLVNMQVNRSTLDNLAENGGLIQADGGAVVLSAGARDAVLASVVNNSGIIQARSVQNVNGTIVLGGGQQSTVANSGTLDASGAAAGQRGGAVKVLGDNVALAAGSKIDVSGDAGGGTALVGGNFHGSGPERNALNTTVAAGAAIDADGVGSGDGGQVAVWSNETTNFHGSISARGGAHGGNGGQVETSGHTLKVGATAVVDTSAANGVAGDWLLDPADITIGSVADLSYQYPGIDVDSAALSTALNNGNVTIKTSGSGSAGSGDITVLDTIGISVSSYDASHTASYAIWSQNDYTLTLSAYRNIHFKHTGEYYSPGSGGNYSGAGGAIDLSNNSTGGHVVLKTDNSGTGTGTVTFDTGPTEWNYIAFGSAAASVEIFYNPTSYSTPTDFTQSIFSGYGSPSQVVSHMAITPVVSIAAKTYDGTTTAAYNGVAGLNGLPAGIAFDLSNATATFADKNAGANKTVNLAGIALTDTQSGKYYLNGGETAMGTISKANLALGGLTANNKPYDATTAATMAGTASVTAIAGDVVSVAGTGAGSTFDTKNVGTGKAVTVAGYTLTGVDAGNYDLVMPNNLVANISKADLNVTGVTANTKTYDRTTGATLSGTPAVSAFGSDAVSVSGLGSATASFADKNAGSGKAVTVSGFTLSGADAGNYNLVQPSGVTGTIIQANLLLSGLSVSDKVYDGTTVATLGGSAGVTPIAGDDVALSGSGAAVFADKNAGIGKAVNVSGYTLSGLDAGNYNLVQAGGLTATIGKADLAIAGVSVNNKTYDGTTAASLSGTASVTAIGADAVNVAGSGTASFADKNAGAGKSVSVSGFTLSGADAGNYNAVQPTGLVADIARADLAISGVSVNGKTYDGTTAATLSGTAAVAAFGSDAVSVSGSGSGSFLDKNAGSGKSVMVGGYTLSGADAGNYNLVQPSGLHADIAKADLLLGGLAVADKVYDGTTVATLSGSAGVTPIDHDDVSVSGSGAAVFADKNAGTGKAVNVSGYTLSGLDAANYNLLQVGGLTANIAKADLAIAGVGANNKVYDGTTAATLNGNATVSAIGADDVTVGGAATGAFANKNAGAGRTVNVSGFTLSGADAANYNLVQPTGLVADIARADLAVAGVTANNKTYDATTAATLSGNATVAAFGADAVSVSGQGSATFADKNAGSGKGVTVSGFTLSGTDAGNYNVVQPSGLTANIDKASLQLGGIAVSNKVYDGTTVATIAGSASVTPIGSDDVALSGSASAVFADKNAGIGKAVNVSGYTLSGLDAANYNLVQVGGLTATIGKADLAIAGVSANNKTYDGTTAAALSGSATVSAIGADDVTVGGSGSASFADKNAGTGKRVNVTGYTLSGADAGNYNVVQPTGLRADIAKADLAVFGVSANGKTYDGSTVATLSGNATVAAFGADAVSVSNTGLASFSDKNAGSGKLVTVSGYTLGGADAGNYNVVQPAGLSADIGKAALTVAGVSANGKAYDGSTAATLSGKAAVAAIAGDAVVLNGSGSASFADKNAGSGKRVSVSGYSLSGLDAGNYTLAQPTGLSADIGKAVLTVSGLTANGKTYDGTTAATLSGTAGVNAIAGDAVAVNGSGSASFADKNAGSAKRVTVAGYTLGGADAANYSLVQPAGLSASITPATLSVSGISASDKAFDGGTSATVSTAGATFKGKVDGDTVTLASTGAFADGAAGLNKAVKLSNVYGGADLANYTIVDQATAQASISQKPQQIDNAVALVQSSVLAAQASAQPALLNTSSTVLVSRSEDDGKPDGGSKSGPGTGVIDTALGFGSSAPKLQIQNGGMHLPPLASSITQ